MSHDSDTDVECIEDKSSSENNSKVEFYSPTKIKEDVTFKVDVDNICFTIHRRGFITCLCGEVVRKHACHILNECDDIKIKFSMCPLKETCRYCEDIVQWNYERFMTKENDSKLYCRQCEKEIESDEGICHDCFCLICYDFKVKCVCCKFCPPHQQCLCDND